MTCPHCDKPNTFNTECYTCMAKKILRDGKDSADRLRLINEFAMVFELNMDVLKSEVTRLFNLTKASNA